MNKKVIEVKNLRKTYGSVVAVEEISFEVYEGEIFGMVGPNGAGKTTTVECVEGIRKPDKGELRILGLDPQKEGYSLRHRIGVQLQETALQDHLKVWEALDLFASFYSHPVDWQSLLEKMNLAEKRNAAFNKLSGGQKQRLFIALSLVNNPELVFFDELTTGLDPQARRNMWDMVRDIQKQGKTVVLTTHFMEEAERLCDRVAIVDQGRIVALDTPENLIRDLGAENRVVFTINGEFKAEKLNELASVTRVEQSGDRCEIYGWDEKLIVDVVNALSKNGCPFRDLRTEQPTLEDVFLALTGKEMRN
ncbi:ABC transporter ATP-binding protein [candidate division KSB1 bacterium]|nr:ABC transporter ATP-binding protein [candidate division KSB1 bacterium]